MTLIAIADKSKSEIRSSKSETNGNDPNDDKFQTKVTKARRLDS